VKFGLHLGHVGGPLDDMRRLWRFADEHAFDWFSVSDHFQEAPYQGGGVDTFEAVTMMTAAAMETRRIRIACLVFSINYRNPGLLAKALACVDLLSGGRVDCGLGAGWCELEYVAYGYEFPPIGVREDQLEEYAAALRLLLDPGVAYADLEGKHFKLAHAPCNPKPLQKRLPIWIGGAGEKRTLRAAARHGDGWNAPYLSPAEWKHKSGVLDDWCAKSGRDPAGIRRSANLGFYMGADAAGAARAEAAFQAMIVKAPPGLTGFLRGEPDRVLEMIGAYRAAGAEQINLALRQPFDWDALAAFSERVIPQFA